jgi:hypothetical protein
MSILTVHIPSQIHISASVFDAINVNTTCFVINTLFSDREYKTLSSIDVYNQYNINNLDENMNKILDLINENYMDNGKYQIIMRLNHENLSIERFWKAPEGVEKIKN